KESFEQKITILKDDLQKEESRNIDRELALEKEVKELNNIVFKRNQSARTVHMLTKPQVFYNHATRQALGFQNPRYLKKAHQLKPTLYDGSVISKSDVIVVPDSKNTLMHAEEMILKLKEKIKSSSVDVKERKVESKVEEIEIQNLELDHRVTKLTAKNNHLKQTYKQLFDSIKSSRVQSKEQSLKEQLKGKAVLPKAVSLNPIDPALLQVDVVSLVPKLRVTLVFSASGSQSKDNTKKNRIRRTHKKAKETELEDHPRKVKSSLNKASVVDSRASSSVIKSVSNVNSNLKCVSCNGCLFSNNHDACVIEYINSKSKSAKKPVKRKVWKTTGKVFKTVGYIWKPTGRTFTFVGKCAL
nr:hypothetical protein [Tanacetum cinerariifolium]